MTGKVRVSYFGSPAVAVVKTPEPTGEKPETPSEVSGTAGASQPDAATATIRVGAAITDQEGRFTFKDVPAGAKFVIQAGKYKLEREMPDPPKTLGVFIGEGDPEKKIIIDKSVSMSE